MNSHWIEIKKWRHFGWLVGAIFIVLGWFKVAPLKFILMGVGITLFVLGSLVPRTLKYPYIGWMKIGVVLGEINSRVILALLFFLFLTPLALLRKLFQKNNFKEFRNQGVDSYRKVSQPRKPSHFETQF